MAKVAAPAKPAVIRRTWKTTVRELLDDIFGAAALFRYTGTELAEKSGLSKATVYRLWRKAEEWNGEEDSPCDMRVSTLFKLAKAIGMNVKLVEKQLSVRAA